MPHTCLTWTKVDKYVLLTKLITGGVITLNARGLLLTQRPLTLQDTCKQPTQKHVRAAGMPKAMLPGHDNLAKIPTCLLEAYRGVAHKAKGQR